MHTTHQDGIITVLIDDRPPIGRGGHLRGRYHDAELTALWPDIVAGLTTRLASGLPRHAASLARQGE